MDSILDCMKEMLGPSGEYDSFDTDIIIHINSILMDLAQLGVGPEGFSIEDDLATWNDFVYEELRNKVEAIKSYMYLRLRLLFDPPSSSAVIESMNHQIEKTEWRLNVASES